MELLDFHSIKHIVTVFGAVAVAAVTAYGATGLYDFLYAVVKLKG